MSGQERLPVGTPVVKVNSAPGELHVDGSRGVLCEAPDPVSAEFLLHPVPGFDPPVYLYCVRWEDLDVPVFISGTRVRAATPS